MRKAITPLLFLLVALPASLPAAVVWTAGSVSVTKANFADHTLPANQDVITAAVALTRANNQGLFNIAQEASHNKGGAVSPIDTEWAFGGLNGNPASPSANDFALLNFSDWTTALGGLFNAGGNIVGRPAVVHLISDDIYLEMEFSNWSGGNSGGGFSYTRTSEIPEPGAMLLALLGGPLLLRRRRR